MQLFYVLRRQLSSAPAHSTLLFVYAGCSQTLQQAPDGLRRLVCILSSAADKMCNIFYEGEFLI
jgi:hypothetical protein